MNTMLKSIEPKSDQLNADDLIGGQSKTIKIAKVTLNMSEQPCIMNYEGDNGKPYKPGKSMRRVLVKAWGPDVNVYVGRSLTLYCDENVVFGAVKVGGIRISHMSDIPETFTMALTATRASRKPFTVHPLTVAASPDLETIKADLTANANNGMVSLETAFKALSNSDRKIALPLMDGLKKIAGEVDAKPAARKEIF